MTAQSLRSGAARFLGIDVQANDAIYSAVSASANLRDPTYWFEIVLAAGIATLGLILNSPAVIIGAMLISPLMGPILALGLALAHGDLVLAIRAIVQLIISTIVAVAFATLLVALLPFREMTAEIAARTRPNTLDLVIALFSGAVGSIAILKEVRGIATSIPGVAIAVALMPPLCVAGYGFGLAATINAAEGLAVVRGGGLLFFTNLVAITLTAMLVFLLLQPRRAALQADDSWAAKLRGRIPRALRPAGTLPSRLILLGALVLAIFVPLSRSFQALKHEIRQKQVENRIAHAATHLWQQRFAKQADGSQRSYIDTLSASEESGAVRLNLRVFTASPYTAAEKTAFVNVLAAALARAPQSIDFSLVEIPTSRYNVATRNAAEASPPPPPSFDAVLASLTGRIDAVVAQLTLPPPALLLEHALIVRNATPTLELTYMSSREIGPDARVLITEQIRRATADDRIQTALQYVPSARTIHFARRSAAMPAAAASDIDAVKQLLLAHPSWTVTVTSGSDRRAQTVSAAFTAAGIDAQRIAKVKSDAVATDDVVVAVNPAS